MENLNYQTVYALFLFMHTRYSCAPCLITDRYISTGIILFERYRSILLFLNLKLIFIDHSIAKLKVGSP